MIMRYQVTLHVETVCLLSKRKPDTTVKIWIDMEDYRRIRENEEQG
nr:MAG TPA: ESSS subunit of NADH:ubiquinone oxidoreductase (complex I) [Caudoviricetes sp.]